MRRRCSGHTSVLLIIVLLATLDVGADSKKRRKKNKKKHAEPASRPAAAASQNVAAPAPPVFAAAPAAAAAAAVMQEVSQCEAGKARLHEMVKQYADENKDVVAKHNKLVAEYNTMLKSHTELIHKFNSLVSELEDPSVATFLAAKAIKAYHHPGIEGAVNKTKIHVLPIAQEALFQGQLRGAQWFNKTQDKVQSFLEAYGGDAAQEWIPAMSGFIVYGSVLIPVSIACWCVLEFVCKLQKLILFGHVYLAVSGFSLAATAFATGEDPLSTFAEQDQQLYQFAQFAFALMFVLYGCLSFVVLCCTNGKEQSWRLLHILVMLAFGAGYYTLVWTPAMIDESPKVDEFMELLSKPEMINNPAAQAANAKTDEMDIPPILSMAPYLIFGILFSVLFLFETSDSAVAVDEPEEKGD